VHRFRCIAVSAGSRKVLDRKGAALYQIALCIFYLLGRYGNRQIYHHSSRCYQLGQRSRDSSDRIADYA
jgi:hypothetical protein